MVTEVWLADTSSFVSRPLTYSSSMNARMSFDKPSRPSAASVADYEMANSTMLLASRLLPSLSIARPTTWMSVNKSGITRTFGGTS